MSALPVTSPVRSPVNDVAVTTPTTFKFFSILTFPADSMRSLSV